MSWQKFYELKKTSAREAVKFIKSRDKVLLGHCSCEPEHLVNTMVNNAESYSDVTISHMYSHGKNLYSKLEFAENFRLEGFFCSRGIRTCVNEGRGDFISVHFSMIPHYIPNHIFEFDVIMVMMSPPDDKASCSSYNGEKCC